MTSVLHSLLALSLILLAGCSSSGIFNGRASRSNGVAQAFETQREAAREERSAPGLRHADAPVAKPSTPPSSATEIRQKQQITEALAEAARAERANDPAAARIAYQKVVALEPAHSFANYQLAVMADNEGRFTEAERYYQTLLKKTPRNADLLASLGWSYLLQGRYEDSERTLREALSVDSKHRTAMYNLGWLYGTLGDYDQSLAIFRSAGSEEDAQRAIRELFPKGRPAVSAQLASGLPKNPFVTEVSSSAGNRGRNENQVGGGMLSAPAPWNRHPAQAQSGPARRDKSSFDSSEFDAAFAQLDGAAVNNASLSGSNPPRIGGVVQAGASDQPLTPPPGHELPVITPRAANPGATGEMSAVGLGESPAGIPLVGELTASRSRNPRGNPQDIPEWPHREGTGSASRASGRPGPADPGTMPQRPRSYAARLGLSAGPGGLPFPLAAPSAAALPGDSRDTGTAELRPWSDQRTADRLPRW